MAMTVALRILTHVAKYRADNNFGATEERVFSLCGILSKRWQALCIISSRFGHARAGSVAKGTGARLLRQLLGAAPIACWSRARETVPWPRCLRS